MHFLRNTVIIVAIGIALFPVPLHAQDGSSPTSQSLYLTMRDGVRIAVDVWLPPDLETGQQIPTLMRMTRYWRAFQNLSPEETGGAWDIQFRDAGYAVVVVDARGSGASEGVRTIEWSPDEVADYGEIVDWIVAQPWSNGRVGAYGISYEGNTAELLAATNRPAVKAVAPLFNDFDPLYVAAMPGGVLNPGFIQTWSNINAALDANDICTMSGTESEEECALLQQFAPGVKRVDADPDGAILDEIVAQRNNPDIFAAVAGITYRDDEFGESGYTLADVSPYALREAIEASGVPMQIWTGWLDAGTTEQALGRFMTFSNPQQVVIGPWDHGAAQNADPFLPADTPVEPDSDQQFEQLLAWFDPYLRGDSPELSSSITYYTMNAGTWTTVTTWPPAGFEPQVWYLGAEGSLSQEKPSAHDGADSYAVNFTTSAGPRESNRWATQVDAEDVYYPDRANEDAQLLTYTSAPLETAIEITGTPVVSLYMASTHEDGALHVYLEAVAPDGRVIYLTEGVLRLIHGISNHEPPYAVFGPYHSYERADAAPLVPGEVTEINLGLQPTSILVPAGYQLRVAIAGADAAMFARYPAEGDPIWTVERNAGHPSNLVIPMRATNQTPLVP